MKNKRNLREKSEKELLIDIRKLLILMVTKGKASQEYVGKCLGVGKTQINNILMGIGLKKNAKEDK